MRPCKNLEKLGRATNRRLSYHEGHATTGLRMPPCDWNKIAATVCIETQSTWSIFARSYFISCLMGCRLPNLRAVSGNVSVVDTEDAVGHAIRTFRPSETPNANGSWNRRNEPTWHDPAILLKLSQKFALTNLVDVQAALSMQATAFRDMPVFRNFFAHRNEMTSRSAIRTASMHGVVNTSIPSEALRILPQTGARCLILEWIAEIKTTVALLCDM